MDGIARWRAVPARLLADRANRYADFLDLCIAITGRAPAAGAHLDANRMATLELAAPAGLRASDVDDALYPALGYLCGLKSPNAVPLLTGLDHLPIGLDELKGFGAAFGTSSAAPIFHIDGATPEASGAAGGAHLPRVELTHADLEGAWDALDSGREEGGSVSLVALGSPHLSISEARGRLAVLTSHVCMQRPPLAVTGALARCALHARATSRRRLRRRHPLARNALRRRGRGPRVGTSRLRRDAGDGYVLVHARRAARATWRRADDQLGQVRALCAGAHRAARAIWIACELRAGGHHRRRASRAPAMARRAARRRPRRGGGARVRDE